MTSSYFKCSYFDRESDNLSSRTLDFSVYQDEIVLRDFQASRNKASFNKIAVEYRCRWKRSGNWVDSLPTILIPIKDNGALLEYTLNNIFLNKTNKEFNIIVIDDRSFNDSIADVAEKFSVSYLRVDNDKGFNFSMLNNIAAKICYQLGVKNIILWNSDLWEPQEGFLTKLFRKHIQDKSYISGARLLYPPKEMSFHKDEDSLNVKLHFPGMTGGKWREKIQFGGDAWSIRGFPSHSRRLKPGNDPVASCDKFVHFVTGALQIINLDKFIAIGGLNPSLSKNFQDVDYCLRLVEENIYPMYYGKDIFFYHDESLSLIKEGKFDKQFESDHVLYSKLWSKKILQMVV